MINYQKSRTSHHKLTSSDLPTAVKSNYYESSPYGYEIGGYGSKSPSKNLSKTKMQQAKNSINTMINQMNNKKNENAQALERIKAVNADALGVLSRDQIQNYTPNKSNYQQPRGYVGGTQYPSYNNQEGYGNEFTSPGRRDLPQYEMPNFDRNLSLEQENMELRRALNHQIRQNNQLLKRIRYLEMQNDDLRNQLGMGLTRSKGMPSTQYNSINYGDGSKNMGRENYPTSTMQRSYQPQPQMSNEYRGNDYRGNEYRGNDYRGNDYRGNDYRGNDYRGNQYRDYNQDYNTYNPGMGQRNLMGELDQLKKQNQRLRVNAVQLLKMSN